MKGKQNKPQIPYFYKFFYKDITTGRNTFKVIEVGEKKPNLAINKFKKEYPDIIWKSYILCPEK